MEVVYCEHLNECLHGSLICMCDSDLNNWDAFTDYDFVYTSLIYNIAAQNKGPGAVSI